LPSPRLVYMSRRCAIWARVSTDGQEAGNHLDALRAEAARRGLEVAAEYVLDGLSAWTGAHREQLRQALDDARTGRYDVLLVWALDRLERGGIEPTLRGTLCQRYRLLTWSVLVGDRVCTAGKCTLIAGQGEQPVGDRVWNVLALTRRHGPTLRALPTEALTCVTVAAATSMPAVSAWSRTPCRATDCSARRLAERRPGASHRASAWQPVHQYLSHDVEKTARSAIGSPWIIAPLPRENSAWPGSTRSCGPA
jgi:resolvase-like protein